MPHDTAGLWLAVIVSGIYHGANPGMGWPLAVSAALMSRQRRALVPAMGALAAGHFIAMAAVLLPFAMLAALVAWQRQIRIVAATIVIAYGLGLLVRNRHPKSLARIPPSRLALWSSLAATAHGAGLMLVPIFLGLRNPTAHEAGHEGMAALLGLNAGVALVVAVVHTFVMTATGGMIAFAVHRWLGLRFIQRSWFNLDRVWAASLMLVGCVSLVLLLRPG